VRARSAPTNKERDGLLLASWQEPRHEIPETLRAGDPRGVHERPQADRLSHHGEVGRTEPSGVETGQVLATRERPQERVRHVVAVRVDTQDEVAGTEERGRLDQAVVEARKDRHDAWTPAGDKDEDAT